MLPGSFLGDCWRAGRVWLDDGRMVTCSMLQPNPSTGLEEAPEFVIFKTGSQTVQRGCYRCSSSRAWCLRIVDLKWNLDLNVVVGLKNEKEDGGKGMLPIEHGTWCQVARRCFSNRRRWNREGSPFSQWFLPHVNLKPTETKSIIKARNDAN